MKKIWLALLLVPSSAAAWPFKFNGPIDLGAWEKAVYVAGYTVNANARSVCLGTDCTTEMDDGTPEQLQAVLDSYTYAVAPSTGTP